MSRGASFIAAVLLLAAPALAAPVVGEPAPGFHATVFDGTPIDLADLRGDVVILNFWATWCVPCKRELPLLDAYLRLQASHGLKIVAVTTEDSIPLSRLTPLARAVAFPMVRNFRGGYGKVTALPTSFIIGRDGILRKIQVGAFDLDDLNTMIVPLLNESAPSPVQSMAVAPLKSP